MALITPDYLQTKTYAAKRDRRVNQALLMQEGVCDFGHFAVTQRGAGANMSVDVAAGEAWVDGDSSADQGFYHVVNDAVVNVAIANNASGNPRIDTLVLKVNDSADAGSGTDIPALEIVQGTPTAAATLANLNGIAALPNNALRLAYILVANGAVKIESASIGNLKDPRAGLTGYPAAASPIALAGAPTQYAFGHPAGYIPSCRLKNSINQARLENTVVTWNEENWDNAEMHSTSSETSKIFFKVPGMYQIAAGTFNSNAGAIWGIRLNGTTDIARAEGTRNYPQTQFRFAYGDYIEMINRLAAEVTITKSEEWSYYLGATWIGP